MIDIQTHTLDNGLRIVHNKDATTQMVALNILYDVGSRDESPERTGLAHLFEHLMFGGSANIPDFDKALQAAGGESNAWTSDDITNYYDIIPAHNLETAFWLESDRMKELAFSAKSLETQRSVVMEEFKQRCLNMPYGDVNHIIRSEAYKYHSYRWPVIGLDLSHIENVSAAEVKDFFYSHYAPDNAVLSVSGNVDFETVVHLSEKWFGDIERRNIAPRNLPQEPVQSEARKTSVKRDVPQNKIIKAYHMCARKDDSYHACDLISDILSNGNSSRFYRNILMRGNLFTDIDASINGSIDPGLMIVRGRLQPGVSFDAADKAIQNEIRRLCEDPVSSFEIEKCVNKFESKELFGNISYPEKASNMAYYELLGDAGMINNEVGNYRKLTDSDIKDAAKNVFRDDNCSTIFYGPDA